MCHPPISRTRLHLKLIKPMCSILFWVFTHKRNWFETNNLLLITALWHTRQICFHPQLGLLCTHIYLVSWLTGSRVVDNNWSDLPNSVPKIKFEPPEWNLSEFRHAPSEQTPPVVCIENNVQAWKTSVWMRLSRCISILLQLLQKKAYSWHLCSR